MNFRNDVAKSLKVDVLNLSYNYCKFKLINVVEGGKVMKGVTSKWKILLVFLAVAFMMVGSALLATSTLFTSSNRQASKMYSAKVETRNGDFGLNAADVINNAAKLLGKPYLGGSGSQKNGKGVNGNPWSQGAYGTVQSADDVAGVDCSGLVYWSLLQSGATSTSGFSFNNPLPVDTTHWLTYKQNGMTYYFQEISGGKALSAADAVLKINANGKESKVNVLKKNESITDDYRYYQYTEDGQVKDLPMGTIVIAYGKPLNAEDHAWITLGDLKSTNPVEAQRNLAAKGVNIDVKNFHKVNDTCTYWRIESNGTNGVTINNADPDFEKVEYSLNGVKRVKGIGPIWAFQVANVPVYGECELHAVKVDENGNEIALSENIFKITKDGKDLNSTVSLSKNGTVISDKVALTEGGKVTFTIEETKAPENYVKLDKKIKVELTGVYNSSLDKVVGKVTKMWLVDSDNNEVPQSTGLQGEYQYENGMIDFQFNDNTGILVAKFKNEKIKGNYKLSVIKTDASGNKGVNGSRFTVKNNSMNSSNQLGDNWENVTLNGNGSIFNIDDVEIETVDVSDVYEIVEDTVPNGYQKLDKKIVLQVSKKVNGSKYEISNIRVFAFESNEEFDGNSMASNLNLVGTVNSVNKTTSYDVDGKAFSVELGDDNSTIKVFVRNKIIDLALKKTITKVNDVEVQKLNGFNTGRFTSEINARDVEVSSLSETTNAIYTMNKKPVEVAIGDRVEYSIKVFNEGQVDARASKITDYIPSGLKVVGVKYDNQDLASYTYDEENGVLKINLTEQGKIINAFNGETLSKDEIIVICEVQEGATGILTNVAEISEYMDADGVIENDIDSTPDNWVAPNGEDKLTNAKDSSAWRNYNTNSSAEEWSENYLAQDEGLHGNKGDDDDFDKVVIVKDEEFKLTINKVNASNQEEINDVLFNITKKVDDNAEEIQENVSMTHGQIKDTQSISGLKTNHIVYTIQEVSDSLNRYIQLDGTIKIELYTEAGKIVQNAVSYRANGSSSFKALTNDTIMNETKNVVLRSSNGNEFNVEFGFEERSVVVTIPNKLITNGKYGLRLQKVSSSDGSALRGVTFRGTYNGGAIGLNATGIDGFTNVIQKDITSENYKTKDVYDITEIDLGANRAYTKLNESMKVEVTKELTLDGRLKVKNYVVTVGSESVTLDETNDVRKINITDVNGITYTIKMAIDNVDNVPTLTIIVPNAPDKTIELKLLKVSAKDGSAIAGTGFSIYKYGTDTLVSKGETSAEGISLSDKIEAGNKTVEYEIIEDYPATGFVNTLSGKSLKLTIRERDGNVENAQIKVLNADKTEAEDQSAASVAVQNHGVVVTVQNPPVVKNIDLALKKVITKVDGHEVKANSTINFQEKFERITDGKIRINTEPLLLGGHDAEYYLNKTPIEVLRGSKITYEIRIYNEGEEDATAGEIVDYIPTNMKFENVSYKGETLTEGTDYTYNSETNTLKISALANKELISKYNSESDELDMDYVTVECTVLNEAKGILTNVAEISKYIIQDGDEKVEVSKDIDSESANWRNTVTGKSSDNERVDRERSEWQNYTGELTGTRKNTIEEGAFKNYLGEEDDDDFEKVKVVEVDLALKKIITKIGDKTEDRFGSSYQRFQDVEGSRNVIVDVNEFNKFDSVTTAEYYLNKTPITAAIGDTISYQIRIYNEGTINATASEIKDYIPKGLKFESISVGDDETPLTSGYSYNENTNVLTISALKNQFIDAYEGNTENLVAPSYKYVTVKCIITGDCTGILTNVAEISKYQTIYGEITEDKDSQTTGDGEWSEPDGTNKNTMDGKSGSKWSDYYNSVSTGEFKDYPEQQDDDDFEKILVLGYNVKIKKYSDWYVYGLEGAEFNINGEKYTTDANGIIDLGWKALNSDPSGAGMYTFQEISANNHITYDGTISMALSKSIKDGIPEITGYTLNIGEDTHIVGFESSITNQYWIDGERLIVTIKKDENGCFNVEITLNNRHEKLAYDILVKKISNGQSAVGISNAKFEVTPSDIVLDGISGGPWGIGHTNSFTTAEDGIAKIGRFLLSSGEGYAQQNNTSDIFKINEIETPEEFIKIADGQDIYVTVNKKVVKDERGNITNISVDSIKLTLNKQKESPVETEAGTRVTLKNVQLEQEGRTVDITAELTETVDASTGKTIPTVIITIPNVEKKFDLALRKEITEIKNNIETKDINRWSNPAIEIAPLIANGTAKYNNAKDPIEVNLRDTVVYGINVYNEGERDGYAELVMDDVPEGLEMIAPGNGEDETSEINLENDWKMYRLATEKDKEIVEFDGVKYVETTDATEAKVIVTDHLSKAKGDALLKDGSNIENPNLMKAFDKETMKEPVSRKINVEFRVKTTNKENQIITNKAQIIKHADSNGNTVVTDRDSIPGKWNDGEDDQDFENVVVLRDKLYDLALRKFITGVNNETINASREPKVDCTKLVNGGHDAEYFHSKEPVLLNTEDIVEYTIRVYNEGKDDAYAEIVMDDVPEHAQMVLPQYSEDGEALNTNAKYAWKMYRELAEDEVPTGLETIFYLDKLYVRTDKAEEAVIITTDYLSMENGKEENLLKAFDTNVGKMTAQNYRDIKVEFKITEKEIGKLVINNAQIYEMLDDGGKDVTDIDSTPGVWIDGDDDQDFEVVKVGKFDLALYKWVTQAIVTEDGKTTTYDSKHTQADKSSVVNVSIPKNKLNKVSVKFKYQIKVTNEGSIAGNALEVKDHIPSGLKFVAEDNKEFGWVAVDDNTAVTDYLKDTVLQPGESAEVTIVLTWVNGTNNFGKKINYAEISKDYNEHNWKDSDSTTDNLKDTPKEDDEDSDLVLLEIRTGLENVVYIVIGVISLIIVAAGVVAIKKFVVNK